MPAQAKSSLLFIVSLENQCGYPGVGLLSPLLLILMRLVHNWCLRCRVAIFLKHLVLTRDRYYGALT